MTVVSRLNAFMRAVGQEIGRDTRAIAREMTLALTRGSLQAPALAPAEVPACDVLSALTSRADASVMDQFLSCAKDLHWRQPGFGKLPLELANHLAVAELIGPDGLFPASGLRIGVLIQREGFKYPMHHHAAEELYFVLHGTATWAVEGAAPVARVPGSLIHHRSFQAHGIETTDTPLCALWGWMGDVGGGSYSI